MHDQSDIQLLRDYAASGSEAAFRELVTRHTDFVFSAALRQVGSPDLAADLAQSVFTDLARKARPVAEKMPLQSSLAGWLHRSTRYTALNHLRDTRRRQSNERQAMEQLLTDTGSAPDWEGIRPLLDEALDSLTDDDREALLLRYFKNQDYRAVGTALGISDDTAQKRVTRAVDRLRDYFTLRKITIGAGGLVVLISAYAIQAAPGGLANIITTAALAGTATSTATIVAATKSIAMTAFQKTLVTVALATTVGTALFAARQAAQLREQNRSFRQQLAPLIAQVRQLQQERDDAAKKLGQLAEDTEQSRKDSSELLRLRGQVTTLQNRLNQSGRPAAVADATDNSDYLLDTPLGRINFLKHQFKIHPEWAIPELQNLNDDDWLKQINMAVGRIPLTDETGVRLALSGIRSIAKNKFSSRLQQALKSYAKDNSGKLPADLSELKTYLDAQKNFQGPSHAGFLTPGGFPSPMFVNYPPVETATLQRYQLLQTGNTNALGPCQYVIAEKAPVDDQYDTLIEIGLNNFIHFGTGKNSASLGWSGTPDLDALTPAQKKQYDDFNTRQAAWQTNELSGLQPAGEKEFQKKFLEGMTPEERKNYEKIANP